jgi:hypothetical protein
VITDVPVDIARETAREAAIRELAKPVYPRESWWDRLVESAGQWLDDLIDSASGVPGGWFSIVLLVLLVVGVALPVLSMARRATRTRAGGGGGELLGGLTRTASEHRALAEAHAAAGRWPVAIRERLRAVARDLEDRAILERLPGRTADELAVEAGRTLPDAAAELAGCARLFDDVTYGDLPGTAEGYRRMAALDERLRQARPVLPGVHG